MNDDIHFNMSWHGYVRWYPSLAPTESELSSTTPLYGFKPGLNHMIAYRLVEKQRFWRRILIIDDEGDVTTTFKAGIEDSNNHNDPDKRIEVYTSNNPMAALSEFKPNFYDLLLVDINMPNMNGFELWEKILAIDINVKVCFMSCAPEINQALREIYPISVGCFIRKPVSIDRLT